MQTREIIINNSFKNLLHNAITVVYLQLTIVQFYIFSHSHLGAPGLLKLKQTLTSHAHVHVRTTCTMCLWSGDIWYTIKTNTNDMYSTGPDGTLSLTFSLRDDLHVNITPCHCTRLFRFQVGGGQTIVDFWPDCAPWIDHKTPGRTTAAESGSGAAETEQLWSVTRNPLTGALF